MDRSKSPIDMDAIRLEIANAHAELQQLHRLFAGREIPLPVARVERAIRAQLDVARSLLNS